jgi:DNA-binding protein YbaB
MFDKARQLNELRKLRSQAKKMQDELGEITETIEKGDFRVKVRGDQKIVYIKQGEEELKELVEALNDAMKAVQKKAAKHMMEAGGGLSGLLGGLK